MKIVYCVICLMLASLIYAQDRRYVEKIFTNVSVTSNVVYGTAPFLNSPYNNEAYTTTGNLIMDIYRPQGDDLEQRPVIVFAHSGGFVTGNRNHDDMVAFCTEYAKRGYVTVTIDYRQGVYTVTDAELHYTRALYRGIQDGRTAVRYLKANAALYNIDPDKIYFAGSSAGAFMGLHNIFMDTPAEKPYYAGACTYGTPIPISAPNLGDYDIGNNLTYSGKAFAVMGLWGAIGNTGLITSSNSEPVLLIHGTADTIVPFDIGHPFGVTSFPNTHGSSRINMKLDSLSLTDKRTYFVAGENHEFYGTDNGMWDNGIGGNAYWDSIMVKSVDFFHNLHKPDAGFMFAENGLTVNFTDESSGSVSWLWSFGDGNTSTLQNPSHTYATAGIYAVTLYIENDIRSYDEVSHTVYTNSGIAVCPSAGDGTSGDPYQIASLENLYWIEAPESEVPVPDRYSRYSSYYIQTSDIDASPTRTWNPDGSGGYFGWDPIGNTTSEVYFSGNYNGNGHKINGLYINRAQSDETGTEIGLFALLEVARISNLGITELDITAYGYAGGLCGHSWNSTISNCYTTGTLNGKDYVFYGGLIGYNDITSVTSCYSSVSITTEGDDSGGLIGRNRNNSTITGCYAAGNVTSTYPGGYVAGLISDNEDSEVIRCYSTGSVTGNATSTRGGLIAYNSLNSLISDCYSISPVSGTSGTFGGFVGSLSDVLTVEHSFWDIEASAITTSPAGTAMTTDRMNTLSTFIDSGWDFTGETVNGTGDYWSLNPYYNRGYPYLSWQTFPIGVLTENIDWANMTALSTGGEIQNLSGTSITSRGICWSAAPNPDPADNHTSDGSGYGTFTSSISGFSTDSRYYYRTYAVTPEDTLFGATKKIITQNSLVKKLDFDGVDDYLRISNNSTQDLGNTLTIEAWVRPTDMTARHGIYSTRLTNPAGSFQLEVGIGSGGTARVAVSGVSTWVAQTGNNSVLLNEWNHIAYTRTGTGAGTHSIYVNGVKQNLISDANYTFINNTSDKVLGSGTGGTQFLKGNLDEIRVWSVARTEQQIREYMHIPLTGSEQGLVGSWQLNSVSGTIAADLVNGNNGTLTNMSDASWTDSGIPFGIGKSSTQIVNSTGTVNYGETGLSMNFISKTGIDTLVVSRIDHIPNINPTGTIKNLNSQYWVVRKYGSGTLNAGLTFEVSEDITSNDQSHPDSLKLYSRSSNSSSAWAFSKYASSADASNDQVTFGSITGFSQFIIANNNLSSPENLTIVYSANPQLTWSTVPGASSYKVYSSADPYAAFPTGWDLETSGVLTTSWTDPVTSGTKKFYIVVAVN